MFDRAGRTALITGAATGLGRAIAITLARQGAAVIISDLPGGSLDETERGMRHFRSDTLLLELDVRDSSDSDSVSPVVQFPGHIRRTLLKLRRESP